MSFDELREAMLFNKIVEWKDNYIRLSNGMELRIEETEQDCCAGAHGQFEDVALDAAITDVGNIQYYFDLKEAPAHFQILWYRIH